MVDPEDSPELVRFSHVATISESRGFAKRFGLSGKIVETARQVATVSRLGIPIPERLL